MNNMINIEELKEICNGSAIMCQEIMPSVKFYQIMAKYYL